MKKVLSIFLIAAISIYALICAVLYFKQEQFIFYPQKLPQNFQFDFKQPFEEFQILTNDNKKLNALLFRSEKPKGVVFYLHGNAGCLASWGDVAKTYTALNYDVFLLDYRGYGKSEGRITSQQQLFDDVQRAYDELKKHYAENKVVVLGYSIGTGPAAKLASVNHPRLLILQAPYYNLADLMKQHYRAVPEFILKYKFETNEYLAACHMPVIIFHGDQDEIINYESSLKLKAAFKKKDTLITLYGQGHNGITDNEAYKKELFLLLDRGR